MPKKRKIKQYRKKIIFIGIGIFLFALLYTLKNTSYFTRAFGFVFAVLLFFIADYFFKFGFKSFHYIIFILIATFGILFSPLYSMYPNYDKILHLISPILFSVLILFLVRRINVNFSKKIIITIAITISSLALFEIGEYLLDRLFEWELQGVYIRDYSGIAKMRIIQDRNDDTMIDLILGTAGSFIFAIAKTAEYYYKKFKGKKK